MHDFQNMDRDIPSYGKKALIKFISAEGGVEEIAAISYTNVKELSCGINLKDLTFE